MPPRSSTQKLFLLTSEAADNNLVESNDVVECNNVESNDVSSKVARLQSVCVGESSVSVSSQAELGSGNVPKDSERSQLQEARCKDQWLFFLRGVCVASETEASPAAHPESSAPQSAPFDL